MSVPGDVQLRRFLTPLLGNFTVFVLHDVHARLPLGRLLLRCGNLMSLTTTILDTDSFYSSNIHELVEPHLTPKGCIALMAEGDLKVDSLLGLLSSETTLLIIDDLNSLYSLASDTRRSQQLTIFMKLLSHNARMNGSWVIATAYRAEFEGRQGAQGARSLALLGDVLVDTEAAPGSITLNGRVEGWPDGQFVFPT